MKKTILELTEKEKRAVITMLSGNVCNSGCAYKEMENSKKECDECLLEVSKNAVLDRLI